MKYEGMVELVGCCTGREDHFHLNWEAKKSTFIIPEGIGAKIKLQGPGCSFGFGKM